MTTATSTRTSTPASTASAAKPFTRKRISSTVSARSTASTLSGSRRRTTSSGSRSTSSACCGSTTNGPTSSFPPTATTRRALSSRAGSRTSASAERASPGGSHCPGPEPGRLRLGGRAGQLPQRTHLRSARRGPARDLLAGRAPLHRQGHSALSRRLLAGNAAVGRLRAAAARARARVAAVRRAEDLQDQSARPGAQSDRTLRWRRDPLLVCARHLVSSGRLRIPRVHW